MAAESPAVKCSWNFDRLVPADWNSADELVTIPDALTRVGNAQGICTVQYAAEKCMAPVHERVPLCSGMTISIDAGEQCSSHRTHGRLLTPKMITACEAIIGTLVAT
jgi:hypothetical protein